MAQILPSDIGLATFTDVGDVANLQTNAKEIVAAINEVFASGGASETNGQVFMEGDNNAAVGGGNVVCGNNNRIIGTGNVIVGDNHLVIGSGKSICGNNGNMIVDSFDIASRKVYFYISSEGEAENILTVGDRAAFNVTQSWCDEGWIDMISVETGLFVTTITEVDLNASYFTVEELLLSSEPPDAVHTVLDSAYCSVFCIINASNKVQGTGAVMMGSKAVGADSFSANYGSATGASSAAFNGANASYTTSFACNIGSAKGVFSFAGNGGTTYGNKAMSVNESVAYGGCSFALNNGRTAGRPIKCVSLNCSECSITAAPGEDLNGLAGQSILVRYKNRTNTIIFKETTVISVSNQKIYYPVEAGFGNGDYDEALVDGYVFRMEDSYSRNFASGRSMAGQEYSQAHGHYTLAVHEGASIFGKYGVTPGNYTWCLANGTSFANMGLAVKVLSNGDIHADGTLSSPCADYAELFEWQDGNPNNEDRAGYFVRLQGDKITFAEDFDIPLGVVSAAPAIIGDSGEMHWQGKYVTDDFGRVQYHDVLIPAITDEEGKVLEEEHYENQPVINPEWDSSQEYVPRLQRPEWAAVGVLGKLIIFDDGTLQSGDLCRVGKGGIAVKSINNGYQVLRRISQDKVLIWFR